MSDRADPSTVPTSRVRMTEFDKLAVEIRLAHGAVLSRSRDAVDYAVRAGRALLMAKERMRHGRFMPWVTSQCQFSHATANLYMRLAAGWEEVRKHPNSERIANLGLLGVDRWLRDRVQQEQKVGGRPPIIRKQYRSVATSIDGFLAPSTRAHELFLSVIPRLELDELKDLRELLVGLSQRIETSVGQIDRYVRIRADHWRADLEADGVFDGHNSDPKLRSA